MKSSLAAEVLTRVSNGRDWSKAQRQGRAKWHVGDYVVHMKGRSGPLSGVTYSYNINPNTLDADFQIWVCGSAEIYYLIPISVMQEIYDDPDAYVDSYHPTYRVASINTQTHQVQYAQGKSKKDFSLFFRATLDESSTELERIVTSDLESLQVEEEYFAGKKTKRYSNYYERNPKLRANTILIHGTRCMVCGFDFEVFYGERGAGFIEVHHIRPVSQLQQGTKIDPETDMIVVCSNCHRMIHRKRNDVLQWEELKRVIQRNRRAKNKKAK